MKRKYLITIFIFTAILGIVVFHYAHAPILENKEMPADFENEIENTEIADAAKSQVPATEQETEKKIEENQSGKIIIEKSSLIKVPFVSQAPTGNWSDPIYQNGCEEAAVLMAMTWVNGKDNIRVQDAMEEIKKISGFEKKLFGHSIDTEIADVMRFTKEYFGYEKAKVQYDFDISDIMEKLQNGNIILVPTYGRALKNPNYTSPGPITHMLVIVGYDSVKKEFITNDPGTRRGEGYRYPEEVLMEAIWNYPTNKEHPQPPEKVVRKKAMMIVSLKEGIRN